MDNTTQASDNITTDIIEPSQFNTCQFIIDRSGKIVECDPGIADKTNSPIDDLRNLELRKFLVSLNSVWETYLPEDFHSSFEPIFLPWESPDSPLALGIKLTRIPHKDNIFITLSPDMAEMNQLNSSSMTDFHPQSEIVAQMLLRLQLSESRLHNYMQNFPGIFFCQRPDLSFTYIGPKFKEAIGQEVQPLYKNGGAYLACIFEKDRPFFLQEIEKNSSRSKTFSFSYRLKHSDNGSILYFMDVRTPLYSPAGLLLGYEGVWLDISRQAIAESRLTSSAWKENLATITSGLVHDFSNIMTGIHSLSELYHDSLDEGNSMYSGLGQIKKSSMQAQKLVRRIIDLNRDNAGQRDYHNLENLINDQMDLIKIIIPRNITLSSEMTNEEIPVYIDDIAFRQMLLNLAMNARDAFDAETEGSIHIKTRRVLRGGTAFEGTRSGSFQVDKESVELIFSDTGCGIPETHLRKIFDAYFSTKEATKGSGFGLYNAKLFIENNRGRISVTSKENEGTEFHILLPLADFTEMESEDKAKKAGPTLTINKRRPSFIIYASKDPSAFSIISGMRDKEWEVIAFDSLSKVKTYLKESEYMPHMLLSIDIGHDPEIEPLLNFMKVDYPGIKTAIEILGRNPDEISSEIKNKVDLLISDSSPIPEIINSIEELVC